MNKFRNKYRIESARWKNRDYGAEGLYYITICTKKNTHFFGAIENAILIPSEAGKIAQQYWTEIPHQFSFMEFDKFQLMPNHLHAILCIDKSKEEYIANAENSERSMDNLSAGGITGIKNPIAPR